MNAPAAISGTFVKIEPVATRKVVRLHVECPIEQANQILAALGGYPDPANPAHVAVARLVPGAARKAQETREPRRMGELPPAQQAALTCQREAFWRYLSEARDYPCDEEEKAAEYVRHHCQVMSRADLATNVAARQRWNTILSAFNDWLEEPA